MKFSIIVPQLFYDLIARVLPGFFFLLALGFGLPQITKPILFFGPDQTGNVMDSLGKGAAVAALSYCLGWVFLAFTWWSKEAPTRQRHKDKESSSKSLRARYQWIRLSHPAAGFRIVKLRAEARMLETSRTAMIAVILIAVLDVLYSIAALFMSVRGPVDGVSWIRLVVVVLVAAVLCLGFRRREETAWDNYWGNIRSIYNVLHDANDPINVFGVDQKST